MKLLALLSVLIISIGCLHSKAAPRDSIDATTPSGTVVADSKIEKSPFSAKSVRIYPLTRIESDAKGRRVLCYVEFKDAWGDTTKSTGKLAVSLYRPVAGVEPGMERQERSWEIDLDNLERNSLLFDPATRTYRLSLRDLPDWLVSGVPAMLRVSMRGESGMLTDDFRMMP